jgi:hypothetical protein
MKSRSSQGVGNKVDLDYDIETMRITDTGGDTDSYNSPKPSILDSIKTRSLVKEENSDTPKISADIQSNKLKGLLNTISLENQRNR